MKNYFFILLLIGSIQASAQKGLAEMIAAEKSFAAYAIANTTQEAFMKFIDTGAIMFDKGEPVNGYRLWSKKEKRPGKLNWRPRFAEISASGDFGYTCGPWTFQPKTMNDTIVASGYFFTIWQKKKEGEWKFIYDGGTDAGPLLKDTAVIKPAISKTKGNAASLVKAEATFLQLLHTDKSKAYKNYLSKSSVLCGNGFGLATLSTEKQTVIDALPSGVLFTFLGLGIAPGRDLGFTYGTTFIDGKKDFYVHFWRREKEGWKLAVEMIRY